MTTENSKSTLIYVGHTTDHRKLNYLRLLGPAMISCCCCLVFSNKLKMENSFFPRNLNRIELFLRPCMLPPSQPCSSKPRSNVVLRCSSLVVVLGIVAIRYMHCMWQMLPSFLRPCGFISVELQIIKRSVSLDPNQCAVAILSLCRLCSNKSHVL
jgi:hypothetical protein